ncbi:MAG: hypothetical protein K2H20_03290, partial [Bacilli bacterium]|nr:hypothetical protein [Bacilli bacterium]
LDKYVKYKYPEFSYEADYNLEYDYLKDYLTKKAYYFYIFDKEGNEYNTKDLLNSDFDLSSYIPDSWLSLGKYKTKSDLLNSAILVLTDTDLINDRLVIYDSYNRLYLKYYGKSVELSGDYFEIENIRSQMFK